MAKLPLQFEDANALQSFMAHYTENAMFRKWIGPALDWADRNTIEVHPVCRDGDWGLKIVLFDSKGRFFDYVEPIRSKKGEGEAGYADRVWKALNTECATLRKMRTGNIVGSTPVQTKPKERCELAWEMRQDGETYKAIGDAMQVSPVRARQLVYRWDEHLAA